MRLFWKIYIAVFTSFVAVVGAISYGTSARQIFDAESRIVNEHKMIGSFVVGDMKRRRTESSWPFENLARLSQSEDFLFWWIVESDGTIRLADKTSFIGSCASRYFSEVTSDTAAQGRVFLNRQKSYGIFVESFGSGDHESSFWLGFSTEEVSRAAKKIVLSVTTFSALALAVLAVALYLTIAYFTKPIKALAEGAAIVGSGRLSHRVPVRSGDELGCLAHAFNQMAEHLETTTTSIDNLNREIAERQRIEDELRLSEEGFKTLFEYAPDAQYIHDLQGRVIDVNKAAEWLTGYSRDELVGHVLPDLHIFPPSEKPRISSLVARNTAGFTTGPDELTLQRKDGSHIDVEAITLALRLKNEPVVLGVGRDITRRKRAEEEMRASEERLKVLFECAPDAIYLIDLKGCFVDGNRAAEKLTGFDRTELIGRSFAEAGLLSAEQQAKVLTNLQRVGKGESTGPDEFNLRRKDGNRAAIETRTFPVKINGQTLLLGIARDITERKKAEEELRESQEKYIDLFENANDSIYTMDLTGQITSFNHAAAAMLGYSPEEFGRLGMKEMLAPESYAAAVQIIQKAVAGESDLEEAQPWELNLVKKDGTVLDAEVRGRLVRKKGQIVGIHGITRDITERRKTEEELRRSEERFRHVAESTGEFIWEVDADGLYTYANPVVEKVLGYKAQDIVGKKHFYDFFLPGEREDLKKMTFEGFARKEVLRGFVNSNTHRSGRVVILETSGMPIVDSRGNLLGYRGADTDVTERTLAQERLRQQTELLKNVISNVPHFVFWKDRDSVYLGCNEAFAKSTAMENPEDIVGKTDYDLVWKGNADAYRQDDRRVMESGEPLLNFEEPQTRADGSQITLLTSKVPLRDASGKVVGILGIYADITDRKLAENRQAQLLEQLGQINQELKDFAYIVSHDLKAPLRAIRVIADWLGTDYTDKLDDQGREYLTLLTSRVDRMQGLIDGVLQYSRIGRTEQGTAPVDLSRLLPETVENLGVPEHIAIQIAPDLPTIEADPTRITQVFQNLLSNAIKYMDKPQGNIAVAGVEENAFWKFSVCDNGPGIEQKHFERIFKLFQTLTPRDNQESTGVGLTITRKIVEMYGGKIWVESEVGRGSTFFFTFPKIRQVTAPLCVTAGVSCGEVRVLSET